MTGQRERTSLHIYVIEFNDKVVKVGRTIRIDERLREHERDARKIGCTIRRYWWSCGYASLADESDLIAFCKERWPLVQGLEYFAADFMAVVEYAMDLDDAAIARHDERLAAEAA